MQLLNELLAEAWYAVSYLPREFGVDAISLNIYEGVYWGD